MAEGQLHLTLRNQLPELTRAVEELEQFGNKNDIPPRIITDFALSTDEVITNIISYGYEDKDEHIINVEFSLEDRLMTVTFSDDARQFNPLEIPEADVSKPLEEREIGGLGIFLVKKLMDFVEYKYEHGRNILIIAKKIE